MDVAAVWEVRANAGLLTTAKIAQMTTTRQRIIGGFSMDFWSCPKTFNSMPLAGFITDVKGR